MRVAALCAQTLPCCAAINRPAARPLLPTVTVLRTSASLASPLNYDPVSPFPDSAEDWFILSIFSASHNVFNPPPHATFRLAPALFL